MSDVIKEIRDNVNSYLKAKYFTIYLLFSAIIFMYMQLYLLSLIIMLVSVIYLINLEKYREEYLEHGKKEQK